MTRVNDCDNDLSDHNKVWLCPTCLFTQPRFPLDILYRPWHCGAVCKLESGALITASYKAESGLELNAFLDAQFA